VGRVPAEARNYSLLQRVSDRVWNPFGILPNGHCALFSRRLSGSSARLAIHLLVPRLIKSAAKFSLPHLHHGSHTTDFILTDRRTHAKIQLQQYILNTVIKESIKVPKIYETLQILGARREIRVTGWRPTSIWDRLYKFSRSDDLAPGICIPQY
jgi:hypothetical protein